MIIRMGKMVKEFWRCSDRLCPTKTTMEKALSKMSKEITSMPHTLVKQTEKIVTRL